MNGMARFAGVLCLASVLALPLVGGGAAAQSPPWDKVGGRVPAPVPFEKTLQDLAGWDAFGLGAGRMTNMTVAGNAFSGRLALAGMPDELAPDVIGFKADGQRLHNLALSYRGKALVGLLPALRQTALADLETPQLMVLLSPPANAGASVQLPAKVGTMSPPFAGGTVVVLEQGAKVLAHTGVSGQTASLLQAVGVAPRDVVLSGRIDPRSLSGAALKNASLQNELINAIDLRLALTGFNPPRKPAYLSFGDSVLMMKGVGGNIAAGIATSLKVNVGKGVSFDHVSVNRDPATRQISIASTSGTPDASFLDLHLDNARILNVRFQGLLDEQSSANDRFSLAGQYAVANSTPRDFTATLSGGSPAQYLVTAQTDMKLSDLLHWSAPGLDAVVLKDVVAANNVFLGDLTLNNLKFSVAVFKEPGQSKYNAAFLTEENFEMPRLRKSLKTLPLNDVQLVRPAFVLTPPENVGKAVLPPTVAQRLGIQSVDLKNGLNLLARANLSGDLASLLTKVGESSTNLVISGNLDPAILSGSDGPLSEAFINATSLQVVVPQLAPQRQPRYVSLGKSVLAINGVGGKMAWGIATSLTASVANRSVTFDSVTINHDPVAKQLVITSASAPVGHDFLDLKIANAGITEVAFTGIIDDQSSAKDNFALNGKYSVLGSTPRDFSATLSGVGASAQYLVTVQTDMKLSDLLGWQAPGLDALTLKDVKFGNDYIQGDLALKNLAFTAVLFKGPGQTRYNAAFLIDQLALPTLAAQLAGTPLADLQLSKPALVLVPQENVANNVALVAPVAGHLGLTNIDLKHGVNLVSHADARDNLATLLSVAGFATTGLRLAGNLDTAILSGSDGPLSEAFINAASLQAVLPAAVPQRKPAYLTFGRQSQLQIWGEAGKLAVGLRTSVDVNVGRGVHFDPVTLRHDPVARQLLIDADSAKTGADFIALPLAHAAITQVALHGVIDEQNAANDRYELDGQYTLGSSTARDFVATLSGGSPAQYEVTVHADTKLSDLMGWSAPGLDAVMFKEVVFGNGYALGNLSLKNQPFTVVVFKGDGQAKSNAAFLSDDSFRLTRLAAALQGTPLDDLELARPGFVLVPQENAANAVKLPLAVSRHVGAPSVDLKHGLNVIANGNAYGDVAALLAALGIDSKNLPLVGTLDASILTGPEAMAIAQPFLDALDVSVPFDRITLPGAAHVAVSKGRLALKGLDKGISASVLATIAVAAKGERIVFEQARLGLVKAASGTTVSVSGAYPGEWTRPFGIDWLNVREVKLAGSFGPTNALAVVGTTDIGPIRHMTVSVDLATKAGGVGNDVVVEVSGADVSLHDIPALSSIPHIGDLKFRKLLLSAGAIGGTLRSVSMPLLNDLEAVAFLLNGRWNLAALLGETDLSKLIALPAFARPTLGSLKLGKAALMFGAADFSGRLADLPLAAQIAFADIFGTLEGMLRIFNGIGLVSRFDPASLGPAVTTFLPAGQKLILQGSVGGFGGGAPSLALSAAIPAVAMPPSFSFIHLPSNAGTSLFVSLSESVARVGVGIETVIGLRLHQQTVDFDTIIAFELDSQGALAVDLQGKSLNAWRNPMGINGFTLDPGTRIETKTAVTGVTLTFVGKSHVGAREVDVTGSANIVGGVIDQGAFEAKLDELSLGDLMALFNDAVKAAGGQPVTADIPDARLKKVDMAFASPGMSVPEIGLPNGGTRFAGDLWFLLKDKALCRVKTQMTDTSFAMTGDIADFTLGPVAMKGNKLDMRTQSMPPLPPVFKISGGATILNKQVAGEIDAGLTETAIISAIDLGGLLNLDLHASFDTPVSGLDAASLASQDMALNAHLKSDVGKWLSTEGKKAVSAVFDSLGGNIRKLVSDIEAAQKTVDGLDDQIAKARARAKASAKTIDQQIADAQQKVDGLADRVSSIKRDISSEKNAIGGCNYSRNICYWWNWRGHCTKHKDIPDVARDAECEAENGRHAAAVAADEAALKAAEAAKAAADDVLAGLKKGTQVDVASLDPEVIALEASRAAADVVLLAAKTAGQGAELGIDQLKSGLAALDRADVFKLTGSSISGNFQKAVAGKPVLLGLDFETAGKAQHLRLAFSLTDPAYNATQFDTLALLVAKSAVEALPGASPAVTSLINDAFKSRHDAADKEVQAAAQDNGLDS